MDFFISWKFLDFINHFNKFVINFYFLVADEKLKEEKAPISSAKGEISWVFKFLIFFYIIFLC